MKMQPLAPIAVLLAAIFVAGCNEAPQPHAWLAGNTTEKIDKLAEHMRGNDVVMWEVQYRHRQLWEAVYSENVDFAKYQLEKIVLAMNHGKERRPMRAPSFDWFLKSAVPPMQEALNSEADIVAAYKAFTVNCTACHQLENVPYIPVKEYWKAHTDEAALK